MNNHGLLRRKKLKIGVFDIFTYIVIFAFFPPIILGRISSRLEDLLQYLQLFIIVILLINLFTQKKIRFAKSHIWWALYCLYGFILTILKAPKAIYSYFFLMRVGIPVFLGVLLCMYYKNRKDGIDRLLTCMYYYWFALILLNCLMMLAFPGGLIISSGGATRERANWLLGSKNNVVLPLLFASVIFIYHYRRESRKRIWKVVLFFGMTFFSLMWAGANGLEAFGGSSTGLLAFVVFLILYILSRLPGNRMLSRLSIGWYAIIFLLASVIVIYGGIQKNRLIAALFGTMGKDQTASYRTIIWIDTISRISHSPIFGAGYYIADLLAGSVGQTYNMFLDCVYRYGLIGLILFLSAFFSYRIGGKQTVTRNHQPRNIFLIGIISMFVCSLVNSIKLEHMVVLLELYVCVDNVGVENSLLEPETPMTDT